MRRYFAFILLAVFLTITTLAQAKTVSGLVTMDFNLSHHPQGQEVRLWIPYPVNDGNQGISGINVSGDYAEAAVYTDQVFKTPMLYARWEKGSENRHLSFSFRAERQEVIRRDFPEKEAAWDPADYAMYLALSTPKGCRFGKRKACRFMPGRITKNG